MAPVHGGRDGGVGGRGGRDHDHGGRRVRRQRRQVSLLPVAAAAGIWGCWGSGTGMTCQAMCKLRRKLWTPSGSSCSCCRHLSSSFPPSTWSLASQWLTVCRRDTTALRSWRTTVHQAEPKFQIDNKLKVIGGTARSIPSMGDMIEDMVNSSVADQLEWPHRIVLPVGDTPADIISDLELKLHGKLRVTVLKATSLKNKERIGKSDPYVWLWIRVLFKKKTKVKDEDIETDKELGITAISLHDLQPNTEIEVTKKLYKSLDFVRVKDKGDRGSITVKLLYHPYTKEEQEIAMVVEKGEHKAREGMANAGVMDAVGGSVKMVGTDGAKLVGNGVGAVGSDFVRASRMVSSLEAHRGEQSPAP